MSRQVVSALIVVDIQNGFISNVDELPVPGGHEVIPITNRLLERFAVRVASQDWHPPDHKSFARQGGPWPVHCVQHTPGAEFHPELRTPATAIYVDKATDPDRDDFSDFAGTALADQLRRTGIRRLFVGGLALDYCVRATVRDGLAEGFEVHLLLAGTRAVELAPGDGRRAIDRMRAAGAVIEEDHS